MSECALPVIRTSIMANKMIRTSTSVLLNMITLVHAIILHQFLCHLTEWTLRNHTSTGCVGTLLETTIKIKTWNNNLGLCTQGAANSRDQFPTSFMIFGPAVVEKSQFRYLTLGNDTFFDL